MAKGLWMPEHLTHMCFLNTLLFKMYSSFAIFINLLDFGARLWGICPFSYRFSQNVFYYFWHTKTQFFYKENKFTTALFAAKFHKESSSGAIDTPQ